MKTKATLKIKKIFKKGYLPARNYKPYSKHSQEIANCFEHAIFNLTEEDLKHFSITDQEKFFSIPELKDDTLSREEIFDIIKKNISKTGLKIKPVQEGKKNAWNVAMYFSEDEIDFHFLRQEEDGFWTGKFGRKETVEKYRILPLTIQTDLLKYSLYKVFSVESPFTKEK